MRLSIRYTNRDGGEPVTVTTTPWVVMLWERKNNAKASTLATVGVGAGDLAYMAWEAAKMAGHEVPISFDLFAQSLDNVEVLSDGDEARPTDAAPSAG